MQEIACARCGTRVLAEKYTARHTGIQWLGDPETQCALMSRGAVGEGPDGRRDVAKVCKALHATIDRAARDGELALSQRVEPVRGVLRPESV